MSEESTKDSKIAMTAGNPNALDVKVEKLVVKKENSANNSFRAVNFYEWLTSYSQGKNLDKLKLQVPSINKDFIQLAEELIKAKEDNATRPSASFKLDKIPSTYFKGLVQQTSNPYFLVTLIFSSQIEDSLRKLLISKFLTTIPDAEIAEYLMHKFENNLSKNLLSQIANQFLSDLPANSEKFGSYELGILNKCISVGAILENPEYLLRNLDFAHLGVKDLETTSRNRILRKILDSEDYLLFWSYLIHVCRENTPSDFLESIIGKKSAPFLLGYFENRVALVGPWQQRFESKNISNYLKNHLNQIMKLEELLPFLNFKEHLEQLLPADILPRAVARCYKRNDSLSALFADKRVSTLDSELKDIKSELEKSQNHASKLKSELESSKLRIESFEQAIASLESKLRSQISEGSSGNAAIVNQGKVEALKTIIESIEHLFSTEAGSALERSLQKAGIFRLGVPGNSLSWDSETCESLTGKSFDVGIVVRSGYTWDNGAKNVLIQRALLREI